VSQPRHRRDLPEWALRSDLITNEATCNRRPENRTCGEMCPRHRPESYASHMARHATDSI